jgi:hypothetical protein
MSGKSKKHKRSKTAQAHVIAKLEPEHVEAIQRAAQDEPVVMVALPKSLWQKVRDWIEGK